MWCHDKGHEEETQLQCQYTHSTMSVISKKWLWVVCAVHFWLSRTRSSQICCHSCLINTDHVTIWKINANIKICNLICVVNIPMTPKKTGLKWPNVLSPSTCTREHLAWFPGHRRNGLATSASSDCIRMLRRGNCNISLQQTSARDTYNFPAVRMGLSCLWKKLFVVRSITEVK